MTVFENLYVFLHLKNLEAEIMNTFHVHLALKVKGYYNYCLIHNLTRAVYLRNDT